MNEIKFPSDTDLERSVLCHMLVDASDAQEYYDSLSIDDFYATAHKKIFESMSMLNSCNSGSVSSVELVSNLKAAGKLEECGGASYIASMLDQVTPMSVEMAIKSLRGLGVRRKAIEICHAGYKRAMWDPDAEALSDFLQSEAMRLEVDGGPSSSCAPICDFLKERMVKWEELAKKPSNVSGISCGLKRLDFITCGFQKSDLVILAARPSMGKTAMAIGFMINAAMNGIPSLFFSLEQSSSQLATRAIASDTKLNTMKFKTGYFSPGDLDRVKHSSTKLSGLPIFIDDEGGLTIGEIRRRARKLHRRNKLGMIFIDHLQLISSGSKRENRNNEIGEITRSAKAMAKELELPVIVLSQLNRGLESRPDKRPKLSDLRESGNIEQDADLVLSIYRPAQYDEHASEKEKDKKNLFEGYTEIGVLKHRDGPTGVVSVKFNPKSVRFFDVSLEEEGNVF